MTVTSRSTSLGKILVDKKGRTLYLFKADKTTKSSCSGVCAQAWPPLIVKGKPTAGSGVKSKLLSTTTRSDGSKEVTYNGHPLYRYEDDQAAGETHGQGLKQFGALWWVLDTSGEAVTHKPTSKPSKSSGGY